MYHWKPRHIYICMCVYVCMYVYIYRYRYIYMYGYRKTISSHYIPNNSLMVRQNGRHLETTWAMSFSCISFRYSICAYLFDAFTSCLWYILLTEFYCLWCISILYISSLVFMFQRKDFRCMYDYILYMIVFLSCAWYSQVRTNVFNNNEKSKTFTCKCVRQGECLSPFLFQCMSMI